jgi:restriction endonuclease Mrr
VHLTGVIDRHRATRGVLVTTGPVRRGARKLQDEDPRVEVLDTTALAKLLSEHCGADWPTRVDGLLTIMERRGSPRP